MTTRTFTPGPWEVSGGDIWATSPWNARFRLATVTKPSPMNGVDWRANARLIAAAPALLAALDYLLEQTVDMDLKYGITLSEGEEDARNRALAAIEQATTPKEGIAA